MGQRDFPGLNDLRQRVHKHAHRLIGNWYARYWGRPSAIYGTWIALRLGLSAHQVTVFALLVHVLGALAFGTGTVLGFTLGVLCGHLAFWLDHVDGQIARWRGTASLSGMYLDYLMHHAATLLLGFGLGWGLWVRTEDPYAMLAGTLAAWGWLFQSLHNDCRYKAMFDGLQSSRSVYRVEGGSGGRPTPPDPWPRQGRGFWTWPAYKSCEAHVILFTLTAMLPVAWLFSPLWSLLWQVWLYAMALLAPALAVGRIARTVIRKDVDEEFDVWFRPR